jgi:hypothetical protein
MTQNEIEAAELSSSPRNEYETTTRSRLIDSYLDTLATQSKHQTSSRSQPDWVVAVDLMTTLRRGSGDAVGADAQFQRLRSLEDQTRNGHIEFVVQRIRPEQFALNGSDITLSTSTGATNTAMNASRESTVSQASDYQTHFDKEQDFLPHSVDRYIIANGHITELQSHQSQNIGDDMRSLVQLAAGESGNGRIGLIIQSHGQGAEGISTDAGSMSLAQIRDRVQAGLSNSGRDQLDYLDFDACTMASGSVTSALARIAQGMVASAEREDAIGNADAQNLVTLGREFARRPQLGGLQMAEATVALAAQGANNDTSGGEHHGLSATPDLEAINLHQEPRFESALNEFGTALSNARRNPYNAREIDRRIERSRTYGGSFALSGIAENQERDLLSFACGIRDALREGTLRDPDGQIARATEALTAAHNLLITKHFGDSHNGYNRAGGLSVNLPESSTRQLFDIARQRDPLGMLSSYIDDAKSRHLEQRPALVAIIDDSLRNLRGSGDTTTARHLETLQQHLRNASNDENYANQIDRLNTFLQEQLSSQTGKERVQRLLHDVVSEAREDRATHRVGGATQWNSFVESLYGVYQ